MSAKAYVLVNTEIGLEATVAKEIEKIDGILEAELVYGVYHIVVTVKALDQATLRAIISQKIRAVDGLRSTLTLVQVGVQKA